MTDVKPTGAKAAAEELWEPLKKVFQAANLTPNPNMVTNIAAIILKHCPQDKAGKLVEALQKISPSYTTVKAKEQNEHFCWYQQQYDKFQEIAEAAISEYERATK